MAIISTIEDERNCFPRGDGEIRGYFTIANMMDKSTAKEEGVASEESEGELSRLISNECAEVLDPSRKLRFRAGDEL